VNLLLGGLVLFIGMHLLRIVADPWRRRMVQRVGLGPWRGIYSLVSGAGLYLVVRGYGVARLDSPLLYQGPSGLRLAAIALMLPALVLLVAAFVPSNRIRARVGHPLVLGVSLWSAAHLIANGRGADLVLFGTFLLWSGCAFLAMRARDRADGVVAATTEGWLPDAVALTAGAGLWVAVLLWLHRWLSGGMPLV